MNKFSEEDIKKVAKGTGITIVGSSIGKGFLFLSQVFIAKYLGVEAFGLYALGFAAVKICEIVARFGLNSGGMRFVSIYKNEHPQKLKGVLISSTGISLLSGALVGFILYIFSGDISHNIFKKPELTVPLQLFAFSIPFIAGMTVVSSLLQGFHTTKYAVYSRDFAQPLSNLILIIGFYYVSFGLSGVMYAFIVSHIIALIVGFFYLCKLSPGFKDRDIKPVYEIKNLISYSIPLLFVGFLQYFLLWTDTLMLGFMGTTKDVGIYRAASQVPFIMTLFLGATNSIYAPLAADLYQKGEMQRLSKIFKITTRWVTYMTVPVFVFILFSAKEIMMLFGKEYIETGHVVLVILSVGQLINCITGGVGFTLTMTGKQKLELINSISLVFTNVLMNYGLIPIYGSVGAALATGISIAAINIARIVEVKCLYGFEPFEVKLLKMLIPSLISVFLLLIVRLNINFHWYVNLSLNFIIVAGIMILFLFKSNIEPEDKFIMEKIKRKLFKEKITV